MEAQLKSAKSTSTPVRRRTRATSSTDIEFPKPTKPTAPPEGWRLFHARSADGGLSQAIFQIRVPRQKADKPPSTRTGGPGILQSSSQFPLCRQIPSAHSVRPSTLGGAGERNPIQCTTHDVLVAAPTAQ